MPRRRNDDGYTSTDAIFTLPTGQTVTVRGDWVNDFGITDLASLQDAAARGIGGSNGINITIDGREMLYFPETLAGNPGLRSDGRVAIPGGGFAVDAASFLEDHPNLVGLGSDNFQLFAAALAAMGAGAALMGGAGAGAAAGGEALSGMDLAADAVAGSGNAVGTVGNAAGAAAGAGTTGGGVLTGGGAGGLPGAVGAADVAGAGITGGAGAAGAGAGAVPAAGGIGAGGLGNAVSGAGAVAGALGGGGGGADPLEGIDWGSVFPDTDPFPTGGTGGGNWWEDYGFEGDPFSPGFDWGGYDWSDVFPDGEPFPTGGSGSGNWWEDFGFDSDPFAPSAGGTNDWLRNLLGGAGNAAGNINWGNLLGGLLTGGLGWAASNDMADAYRDVSGQLMGLGAPYRDLLSQTYQPGYNIWEQPGYADSLNSMTEAITRSYAPQGNPLNNPGLQGDIFDSVLNRAMIPTLTNQRAQLGQFGTMGLPGGSQASLLGAGARGGGWEAVGSGLQTAFPGLGMQNNPFSSQQNPFGNNNNRNNGMNFGGLLAR